MAAVKDELSFEVERLATKTLCAAQYLADTVQEAVYLLKLEKKVRRYVRQASLIVTWKRGSGVCKMVGSAVKTAGGVMVLAAPLHPKLSLAVNSGHRLWKLGSGLKVLTAIGGMLRDLWKNGSRNALLEYTKNVALITSRLGVFQEIISDLQSVTSKLNSNNSSFKAPGEIIQAMSEFIPQNHLVYAYHVMQIVFHDEHYSPLFDISSAASDSTNVSDLAQIIREVEGFRFTEFASGSDARALVTIGSFLHISRELLDFLDGFQKVTDADCRFLQDCLYKFTDESVNIVKVVSLLNEIGKAAQNTNQSHLHSISASPEIDSTASIANHTLNDDENCVEHVKQAFETNVIEENDEKEAQVYSSKTTRIIYNSRYMVEKAVSSVSAVVCKGTEVISKFNLGAYDNEDRCKVTEKGHNQFDKSRESLNRI